MDAKPTAEGTFAKTPAVHLLVYMLEKNLSGTLVLEAPGCRATLAFRGGAPSRVRLEPEEHLLGRVFEDLGYASQDDIKAALAVAESQKRLVGTVLLQRGAISPEQLRMGLAVQLHRRMGKVFAFDDQTKFAYYDQTDLLEAYGDASQVPADPFTLVWMGLRKRPLREQLEASLSRLSASTLQMTDDAAIDRFGFGPQELAVATRLRGSTFRVDSVSGADERLLLYALIITKQVVAVGAHRTMSTGKMAAQKADSAAESGPRRRASGSHPARRTESSGAMPAQGAPPTRISKPRMAAVEMASRHPSRPPLSPELEQLRREILGRAAAIDKLDYFEMLGVTREADAQTVREAFMTLAKRWHPDRLPKELEHVKADCSKVFAQITHAHATLSDSQKREEYMLLLREGGATAEEQKKLQTIVEAVKYFQKAEVFLKLRDYAQAEECGLKAMECDPEQADYVALVGWVQSLKPENQGAEGTKRSIELLSQAIKLQPQHEKAFYYRGMLYKRLEDQTSAIRDFKRAATINPNNVDAVREVRLHHMRGGKSSPPTGAPPRAAGTSAPPIEKPGFFGRLFKK